MKNAPTAKKSAPLAKNGADGVALHQKERRSAMPWLIVIFVMAVIIVGWGWILTTKTLKSSSSESANPFEKIFQQLSSVFQKQPSPAQKNASSGDDPHVQELRAYVFPQFKDVK